jgi:hypothetical protein
MLAHVTGEQIPCTLYFGFINSRGQFTNVPFKLCVVLEGHQTARQQKLTILES